MLRPLSCLHSGKVSSAIAGGSEHPLTAATEGTERLLFAMSAPAVATNGGNRGYIHDQIKAVRPARFSRSESGEVKKIYILLSTDIDSRTELTAPQALLMVASGKESK